MTLPLTQYEKSLTQALWLAESELRETQALLVAERSKQAGIQVYHRYTAKRLRADNGALHLNVRVYCFATEKRIWNTFGVVA